MKNGEVTTLLPETTVSGENSEAYRQRVRTSSYEGGVRRKVRVRGVLKVIAIVLAIVAVAIGAGFLAFRSTVGTEMALRGSNAGEALVASKPDKTSYALVSVELGSIAEPLEHEGPDVLLLAALDSNRKSIGFVEIPSNLQVTYGDNNQSHRIAEEARGGDASLIQAVSKFSGVDVSHYVKIDEEGLVGLVDALGGIEVEMDQVVDDPHAGSSYFPIGTHVLNGHQALVYLRSSNLKLGVTDQMNNQLDFAALVFQAIFGEGGTMGLSQRIEAIGPYVQTDLSVGDLMDIGAWAGSLDAGSISRVVVPGYETAITGVSGAGSDYYIASSDDMHEVIAALERGEVPASSAHIDTSGVNPADFTVEVQNGTNIAGAASVTADILKAAGFRVEGVGNAEQQVYDETLVVYVGDNGPARAQLVIDSLGLGRPVNAGSYYSLKTDVLVILGADYKPVS